MILKIVNTAFVIVILFISMNAKAQLGFDSSPLGLSYDSVMNKADRKYLVEEKDSLSFHVAYFYNTEEKIKTLLFFNKENMMLARIRLEEPHYLSGKQEYKLIDKNKEIWNEELHEHEALTCYLDGSNYVEEVKDTRDEHNGHTVRIQFPLAEHRMIVDVFMN